MKKMKLVWSIMILFMLAAQIVLAQKVIGPVTILNPEQTAEYPANNFNITFAANPDPASQTYEVHIRRDDTTVWMKATPDVFDLASGMQKDIPITLDWAYFPPAQTIIKNIPVHVISNPGANQTLTQDPVGITFTVTKPASFNQHKLAIVREGEIEYVTVQQISPVAGNVISNFYSVDLYFDHGGVIKVYAPNPTPCPCGASYPQTIFGGFSGDYQSVDGHTAQVTMDADKQLSIKYIVQPGIASPTPIYTSTPTSTPIGTPPVIQGDVNVNGKVDINDALLVARYCAGIPTSLVIIAADANCNGTVEITDALLIARYAAGLIQAFCK